MHSAFMHSEIFALSLFKQQLLQKPFYITKEHKRTSHNQREEGNLCKVADTHLTENA